MFQLRAHGMKKFICILLFTVLSSMVAATSDAQTIHLTRDTFDLAHPDNYVIDFTSYGSPGPTSVIYPSGLTVPTPVGDVAFVATPTGDELAVLRNTSFGFSDTNNFVLYAFDGNFGEDSLLITLPANTFSFGTDIASPSPTIPEPYQFTLYSGTTVITTLTSPSLYGEYTFIGYDSESLPITSIAVQILGPAGSDQPIIDNFTVVVPEPSTISLLAVAAVGTVLLARRKLRA